MELPPPEPADPDDEELQAPRICAVPSRRQTRRLAAELEKERREVLAGMQEEEEDINIDVPAPLPEDPAAEGTGKEVRASNARIC